MSGDMTVTIYYGPLSWFKAELPAKKIKGFLEIVTERDDETRVHRHKVVQDGETEPVDAKPPRRRRPTNVAAESGDYASVNDHVITNFVGWIRPVNPKHLHLHNPPARVHEQLERSFDVAVTRYDYPVITRKTLLDVRDHFAEHLVGQADVKESLLTALYPLTRPNRRNPVVVMFYGPSGVGKTESAQFVNGLLGGDLMRKQFSMFHSDQFASYLFGGGHSEASFAHDLLDRESGVILIDEFDKANPIFHSAFYQLFDGGVFEDKNYRVSLGPALIICTSNYNSEIDIQNALGDALFSRFDALIRFEPLSEDEIKEIIDRLVDARFGELDEDERAHLHLDTVRSYLYPLATKKVGNARRLSKLVEETISLLLVRAVLDAETQ